MFGLFKKRRKNKEIEEAAAILMAHGIASSKLPVGPLKSDSLLPEPKEKMDWALLHCLAEGPTGPGSADVLKLYVRLADYQDVGHKFAAAFTVAHATNNPKAGAEIPNFEAEYEAWSKRVEEERNARIRRLAELGYRTND